MAQRQRISREEREAVMLHTAGAVFAERGFHAASMDEIADRVGVSKPMVYSYFGSKEALYFAYIEDAGRDLLAAIIDAEASHRGEPLDRRLHAGAVAFFQFVDEHRDGFAVLYGELAARGAPFRREVAAIRRQIVELVMLLFDAIVERAGVDPNTIGGTEALAQAYVGAGESLANWWLEHPEATVTEVAGRLTNVTWLGLNELLNGRASSWPTDG